MSQLLKQKSKVGAVRESRKKYDAFDFGKRYRDKEGNVKYQNEEKKENSNTINKDGKTNKI